MTTNEMENDYRRIKAECEALEVSWKISHCFARVRR